MKSLSILLLALAPFMAPAAHGHEAPSGVRAEARTAHYGPFRVVDGQRAVLAGVTDSLSAARFAAMLRDHPGLRVLEMRDCPGTLDDLANLQLGRMIRAAGMETHVPAGGSVRSGAVELFLAGVTRRIDDKAEFAVHAWVDEDGLEADDHAADSPINRRYLAYYRDMGMTAQQAAGFYAMTNSVPFTGARWLTADEMRVWVENGRDQPRAAAVPVLAYLDLGSALP